MSTEHFNTAGSWPTTREGVRKLADHHLIEFAGECEVEPADPDACLACYAYLLYQEHEAAKPKARRRSITVTHTGTKDDIIAYLKTKLAYAKERSQRETGTRRDRDRAAGEYDGLWLAISVLEDWEQVGGAQSDPVAYAAWLETETGTSVDGDPL